MIPTAGFTLEYDNAGEKPYWYACTKDGNYDATGATPLDALANLVTILHQRIIEMMNIHD
jgi:hypothetical protein